jgi:hypothetical protein
VAEEESYERVINRSPVLTKKDGARYRLAPSYVMLDYLIQALFIFGQQRISPARDYGVHRDAQWILTS